MMIDNIGTIIAIITGVAGFILGLLSFRKSKLSAIKEFYLRGDSDEIAEAKQYVFEKERNKEAIGTYDHIASKLASHYEFWGKMVRLGYLPLKTFDGAAGVTMIRAYIALSPMIEERRKTRNSQYGRDFLSLKTKVEHKYASRFTV